jgi:hypothetical protein
VTPDQIQNFFELFKDNDASCILLFLKRLQSIKFFVRHALEEEHKLLLQVRISNMTEELKQQKQKLLDFAKNVFPKPEWNTAPLPTSSVFLTIELWTGENDSDNNNDNSNGGNNNNTFEENATEANEVAEAMDKEDTQQNIVTTHWVVCSQFGGGKATEICLEELKKGQVKLVPWVAGSYLTDIVVFVSCCMITSGCRTACL